MNNNFDPFFLLISWMSWTDWDRHQISNIFNLIQPQCLLVFTACVRSCIRYVYQWPRQVSRLWASDIYCILWFEGERVNDNCKINKFMRKKILWIFSQSHKLILMLYQSACSFLVSRKTSKNFLRIDYFG